MTLAELDDVIADIVVDAYGDDEQQVAFLETFTNEVATRVLTNPRVRTNHEA